MNLASLINKAQNIVVVGMGLTGKACVDFIYRADRQITVMDTRAQPPGLSELKSLYDNLHFVTDGLDERVLLAADLIIVSPGIDLRLDELAKAKHHGLPIIGEIEIFAHYAKAPIIGITGSNGKSTVTTLVGDIAREAGLNVAVGGNIGEPALNLLSDDIDVYVLELSSFQLESVYSLSCEVAVLLNISVDHMDRYDAWDDYLAAKQRIFNGARYCVVNADDQQVLDLLPVGCEPALFSVVSSNDDYYGLQIVNGRQTLSHQGEQLLSADQVKVPGKHNLANVLAAIAVSDLMGWSGEAVQRAVSAFKGLPHRSQLVAHCNNVSWINDSKGTNVGATVAALEGLDGPLVLIAGGDGKDADFTPLISAMDDKVTSAVLIGKDAALIASVIKNSVIGKKIACEFAADMKQAVKIAANNAAVNSTVLLSPACASLDMYKNYIERGESFIAAVEEVCA